MMFLWQKNKTKLHKTKCVKITRLRETEKDAKLFCTQIKHFKRKKEIKNRKQKPKGKEVPLIRQTTWALSIAHNKDNSDMRCLTKTQERSNKVVSP